MEGLAQEINMFNKLPNKIIMGALGLAFAVGISASPIIPVGDMTFLYGWSFEYDDYIEKGIEAPFPDKNGDNLGYASVMEDSNGQQFVIELSEGQYKNMGRGGGDRFNPKKKEYNSFIETITPKAQAVVAFNAISSGGNASATSVTVAHTASGSDRFLVAGWYINNLNAFSDITYDGVTMSTIINFDSGLNRWRLSQKIAPATTAKNIVLTATAARQLQLVVTSYTEVDQSNPIDGTNNSFSSSDTTRTTTVTTVDPSTMGIAYFSHSQDANDCSQGAGQTEVLDANLGNKRACFSHEVFSVAQANSMTTTSSGVASLVNMIMATLSDVVQPTSGGATLLIPIF